MPRPTRERRKKGTGRTADFEAGLSCAVGHEDSLRLAAGTGR